LDSVRGSFPATSTIAINKASDREMRVRPTLGQKSTCPARAGSRSIQQIAVSGGFNLIPVAVVRDIQQANPVSGTFVGMADAFAGMSVEVVVTS
jgi:hypothetical protein